MKKKWLFLPILIGILIITFLPISFLKANPDNLIQNGDFAGGNLNSWNSWGDVAVMNGAAVIYSNIGTNSGIRQLINTTQKNLIFSFDVTPRYGSNSGVQIAFNIYKNGVAQGQAFGYFNNLPPMQWSHLSFKVSDFWQQNTGAPYSDFDQIEIIAEAYNGCIAQFDNFSLESAAPSGTTLEVNKDATAESEGYLTWTIKKSVDKTSLDLAIGKTTTAKYTVTVAPTYHETGATVSGNIKIKNDGTSGEAASITYVKDKIEYKIGSGPWTVLTTEDISGPLTIQAGNTSNVPYSVSFAPVAGATAYQNTALVGLANSAISGGGVGFQEFTYTTDFSIAGGTITKDAYADVSDSLQGNLGEAWVGDPATYKYTYSGKIGPYPKPGDYKVSNTATVKGKDTQTAASASATVKVHVTGKGTITVYKDIKAPDGKSEPLIPDNHRFNITLQKLKSSVWEDVETKTISGGGSQVFNVEIGFEYRVVEAEDEDYTQIENTGPVSLKNNEQNIDIRLRVKQKFAIIKITNDVTGSDGNISDNHWFLVRLKGGSRTFYQPVREGFSTYFLVWPGTYNMIGFPETDYKLGNTGSPLETYSNGIYKIDWEIIKNSLLGNGSKIVFASDRDGNSEIYIMNVNGSGQKRLTNNAINDHSPCFSPDGTKIVFVSNRDGSADEIYIMNIDGSGQTRLTNNDTNDVGPCFSPDGTKIAFMGYRDLSAEIYIMNADGTGQTRLTNNKVSDMYPCFSPDGTKIAFGSQLDHPNGEIYIMNIDGSELTRLTFDAANNAYPSFSPDGTMIAFGSPRDNDWEIYIMNADGTGQVKLTNTTTSNLFPSFSPDGTKIALEAWRDGNGEIYIMNVDGSGQANLTNNPGRDEHPSFN